MPPWKLIIGAITILVALSCGPIDAPVANLPATSAPSITTPSTSAPSPIPTATWVQTVYSKPRATAPPTLESTLTPLQIKQTKVASKNIPVATLDPRIKITPSGERNQWEPTGDDLEILNLAKADVSKHYRLPGYAEYYVGNWRTSPLTIGYYPGMRTLGDYGGGVVRIRIGLDKETARSTWHHEICHLIVDYYDMSGNTNHDKDWLDCITKVRKTQQ